MYKVLIFFLVLTSFSCATLDNNLKENPSMEENKKVEKPKNETISVVSNESMEEKDSESNSKETINLTKESISNTQENPTKETVSVQDIKKKEDISPSTPSDEIKKEKEESKKEEKTKEEKLPIDETNLKKDETPIKDDKAKSIKAETGEIKKILADEKALQDYSDIFPSHSKVEANNEGKEKEEKVILPSLEILKELEDAITAFKKIGNVVVKQRVEKTENVETIKQEPTLESPTPEVAIKDDVILSNEVPAVEFENSDLEFNDEDVLSFDDDSKLNFDDEAIIDEELPTSFDDDVALMFDDEEKEVETEKQEKKEEADNKGQLSSFVDEQDKLNISRYTNILKGQSIDFSYPGEGWVYLGEETSQKGLSYMKRKMEDGKTFFTFNAEIVGNYVLNFSYFDVFSGDFIVDAVSVKVEPNNDAIHKDSLVIEYKGKNEKKVAEAMLKKNPNEVNVDADKVGIKTENASKGEKTHTEKPKTLARDSNNNEIATKGEKIKPTTQAKEESAYKEPEVFTNIASINPENAKIKVAGEEAKKIIDEVSNEISNGNAKKALERLNDFFAVASTNMDEAYFLRGKAYELNTELKNIKMALASYKFLTKTFPNSPLWSEADARIRYIEKFFVKIK